MKATNTVKPSELIELIKAIHGKSNRVPFIEGSPGIGKTQLFRQAAKLMDMGFMMVHAPLLQPEDYGLPVIHGADKDKLKFIVSADKFPLVGSDCPEFGILAIDEVSQAGIAEQKIIANLFQEREIHGHRIKDGWMIVATGNRQSDRAGANRILSHLGNRVTRLELQVSLDDWTQWALNNGVRPEVVAFIRFRPELLNNFDSKNDINATPRAWVEGVSQRLGLIPASLELPVFSGDVGQGPAVEFLSFLRIFQSLPNPDAILINPQGTDVPKEAATMYAITGALVARITPDNFGRALEYIKRLPPEFSVLFVKDCIGRCPDIMATKDFISWASKDGAELLS